MPARSFGSFSFEDVQDLFSLQPADSLPLLEEWLAAPLCINEFEKYWIEELKKLMKKRALAWNEDELKMLFIGPLIQLANLETEHFKPFTQRTLEAKIQGVEVSGRVDFMIAKGIKKAKPPYFCIHEYKQELDFEGDPLGQVLIAMLSAQTLNENKFPILGAYILGRNWFFIVLTDNVYAVSNAYDAASEDIFQIFAILQKSKEIIERYA